jgi:hypothetical protein
MTRSLIPRNSNSAPSFDIYVPLYHNYYADKNRFAATVGQFVLLASLRSQVNPANKLIFPTISPERFVFHFFGPRFLA